MGKCYCDYCDVFLTNDSVAVRKQHNDGNRHKYNVCEYYRQYIGNKLQEQIDLIVERFELKVSRGLIRPTYALPTPRLVSTPSAKGDGNGNEDKGHAKDEGADNTEKESQNGVDHAPDTKDNARGEQTNAASSPDQLPRPELVADAPQT